MNINLLAEGLDGSLAEIVAKLQSLIDSFWIYIVIALAAVVVVWGAYIGIKIAIAHRNEEKINARDMIKNLVIGIVISVLIVLLELRSFAATKRHGLPTAPVWQLIIKDAVIIGIVMFFFYKLAGFSGVPVLLILLAVIVGIYHFITTQTVAGRQIYAMGGNAKAARLSGINTEKVFFWVYANMGLLCGVAGIVLSARNASATPKAGDQFEMDAIASCYIGGAATSGGVGTILGAVVGALIMGVLNNGMSLAGFDTNVQKIVKGAVLLGAVTIDLLSKRKKG